MYIKLFILIWIEKKNIACASYHLTYLDAISNSKEVKTDATFRMSPTKNYQNIFFFTTRAKPQEYLSMHS